MPRIAAETFQATHGCPSNLFSASYLNSTKLKGRISNMPTATVAAPGAAPAKPAVHQPKQLPPPNSDFYQLADVLTAEEKATVKKVRTYMETKVQPVINKFWADDAFPFELLPSFKELGIYGLGDGGFGCAGGDQKKVGFFAMGLWGG